MRPTSLVSRERAVTLVVCGHAQVIADDPDVVYRSQHLRLALPVILQVPAYVELRPIVKRNGGAAGAVLPRQLALRVLRARGRAA